MCHAQSGKQLIIACRAVCARGVVADQRWYRRECEKAESGSAANEADFLRISVSGAMVGSIAAMAD